MIEGMESGNRNNGDLMWRELPKNVKQIGEIRERRKIYLEDYVVTYLGKLAKPEQAYARGAVLFGNLYQTEEGEAIFISGAMEAQNIELNMNETVFNDGIWQEILERGKKYFPGQKVMGWFLSRMGFSVEMNQIIVKTHFMNFPGNNKILYMIDSLENEDAIYICENQQMIRQKGYYIYYEKNTHMQEYMVQFQKAAGENGRKYIEETKSGYHKGKIRRADYYRNRTYRKKRKKQEQKSGAVLRRACLLLIFLMGGYIYQEMEARNWISWNLSETVIQVMGRAGQLFVKEEGVEEETWTAEGAEEVTAGKEAETEEKTTEEEKATETMAETDVLESPVYYIVKKGDTLAQISRKMYMSDKYTKQIAWANGLEDADEIFAGQKILIPAIK